MNFIAALLLIILDVHEEHSFWMLVLLSMEAESRSLCMLCGMVSYHTNAKASCSGTVQSNEVWLYVTIVSSHRRSLSQWCTCTCSAVPLPPP